jgi:threonine dehydrogenase-like Zn-dependent dehydrogenase
MHGVSGWFQRSLKRGPSAGYHCSNENPQNSYPCSKLQGISKLKSTYEVKSTIDLAPIVINEIMIIGSRCGSFPPAIRLLENKVLDVLSLISQRVPLDKAIEAIKTASQKEHLKIILEISK